MDLPPGLGGAMAMTVRRLGVGEPNGGCLVLRNWRERLLGFDDKLLLAKGEAKREQENVTFLAIGQS